VKGVVEALGAWGWQVVPDGSPCTVMMEPDCFPMTALADGPPVYGWLAKSCVAGIWIASTQELVGEELTSSVAGTLLAGLALGPLGGVAVAAATTRFEPVYADAHWLIMLLADGGQLMFLVDWDDRDSRRACERIERDFERNRDRYAA